MVGGLKKYALGKEELRGGGSMNVFGPHAGNAGVAGCGAFADLLHRWRAVLDITYIAFPYVFEMQ